MSPPTLRAVHTRPFARASALAHWLAYAKPSGPPAAGRAYAGPSAVAGQTALRPALRIRCGPVHTLIHRQFRRNERVALLVQTQSKARACGVARANAKQGNAHCLHNAAIVRRQAWRRGRSARGSERTGRARALVVGHHAAGEGVPEAARGEAPADAP